MKNLPYSQVINKGLQQLSSLQEKDGSFFSFSSSNEHDFSEAITEHTTFLNSIILSTISALPEEKNVKNLKRKIGNFLLSQKSDFWSWNYWTRESQESKELPYPDDLDDTFCALAALSQFDKKIINGEVFAHVVKLLTFAEAKEGGPYRTWLIKKSASKKWRDIDFAVNSNIAYFLSLHEISLPNLEKYFDKAILDKKFFSPYYPSFYAPIYFLSRFYSGKYKNTIINTLLEQKKHNGSFGNPLQTALAVLALLNLGVEIGLLKQSIQFLFKTQTKGLWKAYGFCIDPSKNGQKYFAGSPALTTVFCLIALYKYQLIEQKIKKKSFKEIKEEANKKYIYRSSITKSMQPFFLLDKKICEKSTLFLQKILHRDTTQQIPLLPYYFYQSVKKKNKKISKNILILLGSANILGWMAYTIFDDFLDEEGNPEFLPIATIALRQLTYIFDTFPLKKKNVQKLFHTYINKIDAANSWELENCRLKSGNIIHNNFEQLANKSIGHALGPLSILLLLGYTQESKEFKYMQNFFSHYIVTKQLNDDAHDWEEDYKKGHLTPVLSLILQRAEEKGIKKNKKNLYELFWFEIIEEIWKLIHQHAKKATIALRRSLVLEDTKMLESLLEVHTRSADRALEEQKNVIAFLKTYKN